MSDQNITKLVGATNLVTADVELRGSKGTVDVSILDASGNQVVPISNGSNIIVTGNVASAATDSGNPIKIGGIFNNTRPTFTDGQRGDLQIDSRGNLTTTPMNGSVPAIFLADNVDGVAVSSTNNKQLVIGRNSVYNGTSWDRLAGNTNGVFSVTRLSGPTATQVQAQTASVANGQFDTGLLGVAVLGNSPFDFKYYSILANNAADTMATGISLFTWAQTAVYNGSTWDRLKGDTTAGAWANVKGGLMPSGTALNTFSLHSTTNATTTPIASTAYISSIAISSEVAGTTSTVTIQDKSGTPLKLVNGFSTTTLTTTPTVVNFQTPVKMTSGIDIIAAGAVAATIDIWINYYA